MKSSLATDRRFDGYDADPLVQRVQECRQSGAFSTSMIRGFAVCRRDRWIAAPAEKAARDYTQSHWCAPENLGDRPRQTEMKMAGRLEIEVSVSISREI